MGCRKMGVRKRGWFFWFYVRSRLSAFARACAHLSAFWVQFQRAWNLRSLRLFAFVCVCKHPILLHPPLRHPDRIARFVIRIARLETSKLRTSVVGISQVHNPPPSQTAQISKKTISLNAWKFQAFAWNVQSRLKTSISLDIFNLNLENSPQKKIGVWWVVRLNFPSRLKMSFVSISLENFNLVPKDNLKITQDFPSLPNPQILGKDRENTKITKEFLCLEFA